jgi:uncharacterized protein (TIRG00374 family)
MPMKIRRMILLLASLALGCFLVAILVRFGKVDLRLTVSQLAHASLLGMLKLLMLNGVVVLLSTMKWRATDAALRHPSDPAPSGITAFSISSAGMALGLVLPVQFGMTAARTVGTLAYGKTIRRGAGGTVFEQGFDLLITITLSAASVATWLCHGEAWMWYTFAAAATALALIAVRPLLWLVKRLLAVGSEIAVRGLSSSKIPARTKFLERFLKALNEIRDSALINPRLVRQLLVLSVLRFAVVVLMAQQTALISGTNIRLWTMAAAIPFAAISNFIALTPGGVGVNEITSVTALHIFGTPISVASQWAIVNRIVITGSYFIVAIASMLLATLVHLSLPSFDKRQDIAKVEEI